MRAAAILGGTVHKLIVKTKSIFLVIYMAKILSAVAIADE